MAKRATIVKTTTTRSSTSRSITVAAVRVSPCGVNRMLERERPRGERGDRRVYLAVDAELELPVHG